MPTRIFCIMCKLKLWYLTILWKTRWVGWGGGLKQFWKSRWKGGVKKTCLPLGGWIFSGITQLAPTCTSHPLPLKKNWSGQEENWLLFSLTALSASCRLNHLHSYAIRHLQYEETPESSLIDITDNKIEKMTKGTTKRLSQSRSC